MKKFLKINIIYIDLCELYFITSKYLRPYLLLIIDNKIIIYASVNYSYLLKQKNYSNYYFKYIIKLLMIIISFKNLINNIKK